MTTYPTDIPGIDLSYFDFSEEVRDRIWGIYRDRRVNKMTFQALAERHGVSKQRMVQIYHKAHKLETKRAQLKRRLTRGDVPLRMENIPMPRRCYLALRKLDALRMTPDEFAQTFTFVDVAKVKSVGFVFLKKLYYALENVCPDAANLWAARNRENNNPA